MATRAGSRLIGGALALAAFAAAAQTPSDEVLPAPRTMTFTELERAEGLAVVGHYNELWRVRALRALKINQPDRARADFERAAGYADKYSQHALSLMYWHGVGGERDRALAYAWSDIAAERGYRDLLLVREKMWLELSEDERERARRIGPEMYARYGDEAARPRQEWEMRKGRNRITGSRLGFEMDRVQFMGDRFDVDPKFVFARDRWAPGTYWQVEDRTWNGKVIVLPAEKVPDESASPAD